MLKIALRNILRQRRRSLLTVLTMLGGFVLAAVSIAWGDGTYNDVIRMFTHNRLGDIEIHAAGYLDNPSLYKTIRYYMEIGRSVSSLPHVSDWTPRLLAGALASAGNRTTAVQIIGIDPDRENATTGFDRKVVSGRTFAASGTREAVIGSGVARLLDARIGQAVVIVSQAADGSLANDLFTVVGITASEDEAYDRTDFYLRLRDAQELLALQGQVHEIVVTVDRLANVQETARRIRQALHDPDLSVAPWQEFARDFYRAMNADLRGMWIMLFIIVLIVAIGVLNTVLMAVLERRREYGVLLALGTRPAGIFRMVLCEATAMACISLVVGAAIAFGINYLLSIHGIALSHPYSYGGMTFERFRTEINLRSFAIPGVTVLLSAAIVAAFPALKAARTDPARSMRMH
jgi:putative ABC transport system permease protein